MLKALKYSRYFTLIIMGLFLLGVVLMAFNADASEDFLNSPQGTSLIPVFMAVMILMIGAPFSPLLLNWLDIRRKKGILKVKGVKGLAKIIEVKETGITINNNPYPLIRMQVDNNHVAEFCLTVSRLSIPRVGDNIEIVYDPADPSIALPSILLN
ncbi:hypothetical protein IT411_00235 [Candidatus Peregrinibacteria bacterium]|nr:hypothetical protein [Candidatus Peregrinibacteria bacterium]